MNEIDWFAHIDTILHVCTSVSVILVLVWQIRRHSKNVSADVSLKMLERVRTDEFRQILKTINDGKSSTLETKHILKVLIHYEYLALFEKEKVLDFNHVLHVHGMNLKTLYNDVWVRTVFEENRDKQHKSKNWKILFGKRKKQYSFVNLNELFKKIDKEIQDY